MTPRPHPARDARCPWLAQADDLLDLATRAKADGNNTLFIAATIKAAECVRIAKNLARASAMLGPKP